MPTKKKVHFPVRVNKKFMLDLANDIYDPKTKRFMRLCDGTLQNGPDPKDDTRPMHCGLGELYFAMTGHQPKEDHVSEGDVIQKAVELSAFNHDETADRTEKLLVQQGLDSDLVSTMVDQIHELEDDEPASDAERMFRDALDEIPGKNDGVSDDCCGRNGSCSYEAYRRRSQKVAAQFRLAAKHLPE